MTLEEHMAESGGLAARGGGVMSSAYYNEHDPYAAQWLRNLIAAGHIAAGEVDERSIEDVFPGDLAGFTQCHFFAGIGVWSFALRRAGWPDDRPVWTGSCPCQPFSAAGQGLAFDDERHLWPAWHYLIQQRRPAVIFGEQVEAAIRHGWLDLVQSDLEGIGYSVGAAGIPAAGVGAPHIRQRLYFVADTDREQHDGRRNIGARWRIEHSDGGELGGVGYDNYTRLEGLGRGHKAEGGRNGAIRPVTEAGESSRMADDNQHGRNTAAVGQLQDAQCDVKPCGGARGLADNLVQQRQDGQPGVCNVTDASGRIEGAAAPSGLCGDMRPGPTNSHWRDADWLFCRDEKWRPVEPGTFPLVNGTPARVGRLRAYGNAIVAKVAEEMISAYMECRP